MGKLEKVEKVKILADLFELVQYYYEYRDQPMRENENFLSKVEVCCDRLEIDFTEFKKEFKLD
ncbi:MAG: hypothetical protein K6T88_15555 [Bacillus sp. (in: Bacteria)]|nr:hypothetical protein [Bacillus sp. (in: firmicutes)]